MLWQLFSLALFNGLMLGLALWQQWSVVVVLLAYVVESLLFSVFLVPVKDWGSRGRVPLEVLPFAFINMALLLFLCFSAYTFDTPPGPVLTAVVVVLLGFFVQYASVEVPKEPLPHYPTRWEVWFRTIPALLSVLLLSSLIDSSSSVEETSLVILVFYPIKTFLEVAALIARRSFPQMPVQTARLKARRPKK